MPATFTWTTSADNFGNPLCEGEGWVVSGDGKTIRFNIANSDDSCGGGDCNYRQTGTAQCVITTGEEPKQLYLLFNGYAEEGGGELGEFENITITLSGVQIAHGGSGGIAPEGECMAEAITIYDIEPPYVLEPNSTYVLNVFVDTDDPEIHRDAFWEVKVDYNPISLESEFERVANLHGGVANFLRLRLLGQF